MRVDERGESERDQRELDQRGVAPDAHQADVADARAPERHDGLGERGGEREHKGEMADLDNHCVAAVVSFLPAPLFLQRVDDFARHIALVVLGEDRVGAHLAGRREHAFGDHALTLAEQVRQETLIGTP